MHLFSVWRSKIFFFRKSCVDFNFISLIHSYVYLHIALCYQELFYKTLVIIWPCHIRYSENYHQLFKHWLIKLSKISWLHVLNVLFFPSNILKNTLKYILNYLSVTMSYLAWHNYWLIMSYVLKIVSSAAITCVPWIWSYHMISLSSIITNFSHFQGNVFSI